MEKCEGCGEKHEPHEINNYVVEYNKSQAYNTCSKECAEKAAIKDGITSDEINNID